MKHMIKECTQFNHHVIISSRECKHSQLPLWCWAYEIDCTHFSKGVGVLQVHRGRVGVQWGGQARGVLQGLGVQVQVRVHRPFEGVRATRGGL